MEGTAVAKSVAGGALMADDRVTPRQVSLKEDYEIRYWSERFGVSREELREAVNAVGIDPARVSAHIHAQRGR
jgi:hypothetical protein